MFLSSDHHQLTLKLNGLGRLGEALAEFNGKPVYVFGGIPGETVVVNLVKEHRGYIAAEVVHVLEASPHRAEPPCPYFGECTGCQWQHITYERQLEIKQETVMDALRRVGGLDPSIVEASVPSPAPFNYRNHARFTVSKPTPHPGRIGYIHREKRQHVEVENCMLMTQWINEALVDLQGRVGETTQLSLRYGVNTGDWLLQPTFRQPDVPLESGQKHYTESLLGHTFRVSSPSFFQVNTLQAERMVERVITALEITGEETIVDAYAGVGTFAILLADHVKRVIAVEESKAAIADCKSNLVGLTNVELREARAEDVLAEFAEQGLDAVILDPPRAGCMGGTLDALLEYPPRRIIYVSCDPETLARDLAILTAGPFSLDSVTPIDMFPQTHHIESISVLTLDENRRTQLDARAHLVLASASPRRSDILNDLGLDFEVVLTEVEEPPARPGQSAQEVAIERALIKARAGAWQRDSGTVIGADTVVELDEEPLGKPVDADDARRMLTALRGREHRVITSVALVDAATGETRVGFRSSRVVLREYGNEEIESYIDSGDPFDKAGAYAVQNSLFAPADEVKGCYLNVVGLPVCTLLREVELFGIRLKPHPSPPWEGLLHCPECARRSGLPTKQEKLSQR